MEKALSCHPHWPVRFDKDEHSRDGSASVSAGVCRTRVLTLGLSLALMMSPDQRRKLRKDAAVELHWLDDSAREGRPAGRMEFLLEFPSSLERLDELQTQGLVLTDANGRLIVSEWVKNWLKEDDRLT